MIEAGLDFEGSGAIERVVKGFIELAPQLRPVYFSREEKPASDEDRVDDHNKLADFISRSKSGFFFLGPGVSYNIRVALGKPLICDCFLDLSPEAAEQFLTHMSKAKPVFGFACAPGERQRRNQVTVQQGENIIESWVGRDPQKYVPGFYWLTLLPQALAKQHGVELPAIQAVAREHIELEGGQQLYRFYERPEDWQDTDAVSNLCASLPGVFDVEKVKRQLLASKTFLDLHALLRKWR